MKLDIKELARRNGNGAYFASISCAGSAERFEIYTANCIIEFGNGLLSIYTKDSIGVPTKKEADIRVRGISLRARQLEQDVQRELIEFAISQE